MAMKLLLATIVMALGLTMRAMAQDAAWTPTDLAALIGKDVPKSLAAMNDVNPEDHYAVGIDVFSGPATLQVGKVTVPVLLQVYTRNFNVGAIRVVATGTVPGARAAYTALRTELLASRVAADGDPGTAASWNFVDAGTVNMTRRPLGFTVITTGMADSYAEFWRNSK